VNWIKTTLKDVQLIKYGGVDMIRKMNDKDLDLFLKFTKLFYESDAVLHQIPDTFHVRAFKEIMNSQKYIEGYIFECEKEPVGYAITAKSYSHEAGGLMLWIVELYIAEDYRSMGIGKEFFDYLRSTLDQSIMRLRLEVESENEKATKFYQKMGFNFLEYDQMYKDIGRSKR